MLSRIQLIKGIGQFEAATLSSNEEFNRLTVIYGENGRGKTTVSSIFASLMSGDPSFIAERKRLGATDPPHVVLKRGANGTLQFKDGYGRATCHRCWFLTTLLLMQISALDWRLHRAIVRNSMS